MGISIKLRCLSLFPLLVFGFRRMASCLFTHRQPKDTLRPYLREENKEDKMDLRRDIEYQAEETRLFLLFASCVDAEQNRICY